MPTQVKMNFYRQVVACKRLLFPILADNPNVDPFLIFLEIFIEIALGVVDHDLVDIFYTTQDLKSFFERHDGLVLIRPIKRGIGMKTDDEIFADALGLLKHHEMPCVAEVKCTAGEADGPLLYLIGLR